MNDYTNDPAYIEAKRNKRLLELQIDAAEKFEAAIRADKELKQARLAAAEAIIDQFEDAAFDAEFPAIRRAIASMQTA